MGYERQSLSFLMQDGFWMPLDGLQIQPFQNGIYSLEGDVATLLKRAGMNGMISFLADRNCYALPLQYRDANGLYMKFMWVFKDFAGIDVGYPQSLGWFTKQTSVARMSTADFCCCALNGSMDSMLENEPELAEGPLTELIARIYVLYENLMKSYPLLEVEEMPLYPSDYDEDDESAKPIGYTLRFADGVISVCHLGFLSLSATTCVIKGRAPGTLRTVKPAQFGMDILQWPQ